MYNIYQALFDSPSIYLIICINVIILALFYVFLFEYLKALWENFFV